MGPRDGAYAALTEAPGGWVSEEGARMLQSRYAYGAQLAASGRVLEVGCGPGLGLGLLDASSSLAVGADYDSVLLGHARKTYRDRIPLVRLDVQYLPFADGSFDTVLFYEGSYYVPDMGRAFDEMTRVLTSGGQMVFVNANPERPDFIPSPLSFHYHSGEDFRDALEERCYSVQVEGAFPLQDGSRWGRLIIAVRKLAHRLGMIPGTLRARALLKRLLVGPLVPVPQELLPGEGGVAPLTPLEGPGPHRTFKVLYVTAQRS